MMYFVKVSLFSSLISSATIPPLFVMMIEPNIDAERFFTYVLPVFIVSFIVIIIFTILFVIPAHILTNKSNNFNLKNTLFIGGLTALTVDLFYIGLGILDYPIFFFCGIIHSYVYWLIAQKISQKKR
ncbi:hypothetical protein BPUTSESOX_781 [uncultured Gammaproteobacteria bacterium]|uniref:hypothetical protein n=1 Tax=thiotrophic endosymbiont of Bathymodiolus puteoserpentis (Logatchev) TaxID=343240 RepID=UPI0010BB226B|nr:hypothetical protein [thiotrophic endosymbiont of Bathymodiolus puteoserpentis (Logatchev)]SSC10634.1 hypothetical protein BPUTEOSOX_1268 [thiotrophic endosymbiont of Bathymodiolus puteoserpentis (Logatchev)]VVH51229.1 hypothetical protein BPUTSESOX_781 [uncultured Gammaproteobacteria bacterium]